MLTLGSLASWASPAPITRMTSSMAVVFERLKQVKEARRNAPDSGAIGYARTRLQALKREMELAAGTADPKRARYVAREAALAARKAASASDNPNLKAAAAELADQARSLVASATTTIRFTDGDERELRHIKRSLALLPSRVDIRV